MEQIRLPKLKESSNLGIKSYSYYESGQPLIVVIDSEKGIISTFNRKSGAVLGDLEVSGTKLSIDLKIKPGKYVLDVVGYAYGYYHVVDILYDSNVDLLNFTYADRLNHLNGLNLPSPFYPKKYNDNGSYIPYPGFSDTLIYKDNEANLTYNADYKIPVQKTYKIMGTADYKHKVLKKDIDVAKLGAEYSIPSATKAKLLKSACSNAKLSEEIYDEVVKKILLVADYTDCIFGYCMKFPECFETEHKVTNHAKQWLSESCKQKYTNVQYLAVPVIASFSQKASSKKDLFRLKLCKILSEQVPDSKLDLFPLKVNKLYNNIQVIDYLLTSLKLPNFANDESLHSQNINNLLELRKILHKNGGNVSLVSKPSKRKADHSGNDVEKKPKMEEVGSDVEEDME